MADKIAKFLDMDPIMESETRELAIQENNTNIEEIKSNIQDLIDVSKVATAEMYSIATSSQDSKNYDTLAKLIKTTADVNKDFLEIEMKQREMNTKKDSPNESKVVHNTIVFQGTTEEILKQLEAAKK